jgi:3-oxoadipate enol-lactonase
MDMMTIRDRPHAVHADGPERGRPVLFLHSLGLDHRVWLPTLEPLSQTFRLLAPDLLGHGAVAGATELTSIADASDHLVDMLDHLEIERIAVAGLSLGGAVAQRLALRHPHRVGALALIATMPKGVQAFRDRAEAAERDGMAAQIDATLTRWFTPAMVAADLHPVAEAREILLRTDISKWARAWRALADHDTLDSLSGIAAPALCVAGELDPSTPPSLLKTIADRLPHAQYVDILGAPHLLPLTYGPALAVHLMEFLQAHASE